MNIYCDLPTIWGLKMCLILLEILLSLFQTHCTETMYEYWWIEAGTITVDETMNVGII